MEAEPMDFFVRSLPSRLQTTREAVAHFVGGEPEGVVFVANATSGVNAVLRSLDWRQGDEILLTDHGYAACEKATRYTAGRHGARVVVAELPFPVSSPEEILEGILSRVGPRTRLAMIDHVTSPTALRFPMERIVSELRERGVETLVDGAHALGMLPLDLQALGAAYYTANAHKWLCAPKGAAVLYARKDRRATLHPLVISHGFDPSSPSSRFSEEFDWPGTFDPTPWLVLPDCIDFLGSLLPGGWPALMDRNRLLALRARARIAETLGIPPPAPEQMIASMASLPLPEARPGTPARKAGHEAVMGWLRENGIESWLHPWNCPGGKVVRVSAQLYNDESQFVRLADALVRVGFGGA
jgi:isopenicillin-N epimerase